MEQTPESSGAKGPAREAERDRSGSPGGAERFRPNHIAGRRLGCANLAGSDLSGARLAGSDLSTADLSQADLAVADPAGADTSGACLIEADLWSSTITDTSYPGSDLSGANLEKTGIFREEALRRFPDIQYSAATRWDVPGGGQ